MQIALNGEPRQVREDITLADLLAESHYIAERVATMVNGDVIARDTRGGRLLRPGDRVEVVSFAGGG